MISTQFTLDSRSAGAAYLHNLSLIFRHWQATGGAANASCKITTAQEELHTESFFDLKLSVCFMAPASEAALHLVGFRQAKTL